VLYEMISGKRAFKGESAADTLSAILREEPPDLTETNRNDMVRRQHETTREREDGSATALGTDS